MRAPRTQATKTLRRLTALGLAAWLAGMGCVLGCSAVTASAHHTPSASATETRAVRNEAHHGSQIESHPAEQPDSCAAMSGHDCCAGGGRGAKRKSDGRSTVGTERQGGRTAMHCPLGRRHAADPARKVLVDTGPAAAAPATESPAPAPGYAAHAQAAGALVRDRGSTYLRCCAFLI